MASDLPKWPTRSNTGFKSTPLSVLTTPLTHPKRIPRPIYQNLPSASQTSSEESNHEDQSQIQNNAPIVFRHNNQADNQQQVDLEMAANIID